MLRQNLTQKKKKRRKENYKRLKSPPRDLILGYPIWFSRPNWTVKTIVPLPRND